MADKNIGSLPAATGIQDDTLMVGEQQGEAVKLTGAQWKDYAKSVFEAQYDAVIAAVLDKLPVAEELVV